MSGAFICCANGKLRTSETFKREQKSFSCALPHDKTNPRKNVASLDAALMSSPIRLVYRFVTYLSLCHQWHNILYELHEGPRGTTVLLSLEPYFSARSLHKSLLFTYCPRPSSFIYIFVVSVIRACQSLVQWCKMKAKHNTDYVCHRGDTLKTHRAINTLENMWSRPEWTHLA